MTSIKRILLDILDFEQSKENNEIEKCFIYYDEENIMQIYVMIIGPEDTPYSNGFYIFQFDFPSTYPQKPPKVKFLTTNNGTIRFHPNLYQNGKVCLSILGTWTGPQWSPVMTLKSIILCLQSILTINPLKNEPGYEHIDLDSIQNINYNIHIYYYNIQYAIIEQIKQSSSVFYNIMNKYFKENESIYKSQLSLIKQKFPEKLMIKTIYNFQQYLDFSNLSY